MSRMTIIAASLALGLGAVAAHAERCTGAVEGHSSVQHALTSATDGATPEKIERSYHRAFAAGRDEAIAAWSRKAVAACSRSHGSWAKAADKSLTECDRAMGGRFTVCAKAIPR